MKREAKVVRENGRLMAEVLREEACQSCRACRFGQVERVLVELPPGGEYREGETIKIHFHTNEPWKVLEYCASLGDIYDGVIENLRRQANGLEG